MHTLYISRMTRLNKGATVVKQTNYHDGPVQRQTRPWWPCATLTAAICRPSSPVRVICGNHLTIQLTSQGSSGAKNVSSKTHAPSRPFPHPTPLFVLSEATQQDSTQVSKYLRLGSTTNYPITTDGDDRNRFGLATGPHQATGNR